VAISLGEYKIAIDSKDDEANVNFVSHAHSDHVSGLRKNNKAIASEITKDLIESRSNVKVELIEEPECVQLLNAGHILGSKQLYVQNDLYGYSILYSGDYQTSEPIIAEKIETKQADVLIVDSTYPYPDVKFDDRSEVITALQHYARMKMEKGNVLFGAYAIGRSQELVKLLNDVGIVPIVDEKVAKINKVYEKHGVRLEYNVADPVEEASKRNIVAITGQSKLDLLREEITARSIRRVFTAVASGWAKIFKFDTDVQFNLSDHADFSQAIEYINACSPKIVFTFGSSAKVFAKNLVLRGYDARPLQYTSEVNRLMLNSS
jgi:putative mRNA 3-end processing factor